MSRGRRIILRLLRSLPPKLRRAGIVTGCVMRFMVTQKTRRALHASMAAGSGQHWGLQPAPRCVAGVCAQSYGLDCGGRAISVSAS